MLALRSVVFNIAFYLNLTVLVLVFSPILFMSRHQVFWLARLWGANSLWLLDKICGLKVEYRGMENIPQGGFIIAPKHQSVWETFALLPKFPDFCFVLKRELTWIPWFGWYTKTAEQIAINRASGSTALAQVTLFAQRYVKQGRQVFIFPEGTRRQIGSPPLYKYGVAHVYAVTGARCLPVALNAGLFWPRRSFIRRPGTVVVEFLPVIEPGLDKAEFIAVLEKCLEAVTERLIAEAVAADPSVAQALPATHPLARAGG